MDPPIHPELNLARRMASIRPDADDVSSGARKSARLRGGGGGGGHGEWRDSLFATMAGNHAPRDYYNIPPNCVIELGTKIAI